MTVFGYAGFVGSPADLVVALGGPSFIADLRAIALQAGSVRVQLASVPSAVNANSDISAALSFVDEVFDRTSADRPWTLGRRFAASWRPRRWVCPSAAIDWSR